MTILDLIPRAPLLALLLTLGASGDCPTGEGAGPANGPGLGGPKFGDDGVGGIEFTPRLGGLTGGSRLDGGSPVIVGSVDHGDQGGGGAGPWVDLGQGTPGTHGVPVLSAHGQPVEQGTVSFRLLGLEPGALTIFIIGFDEVSAPLLGGTLVPSPDWVSQPVFANGAGIIAATGTVPEAMPSGFTAVIQAWAVDTGAPQGFAASNALVLTTP
jgi:hypothetical protein